MNENKDNNTVDVSFIQKTDIVIDVDYSSVRQLACAYPDACCEDDDGKCCDFGD